LPTRKGKSDRGPRWIDNEGLSWDLTRANPLKRNLNAPGEKDLYEAVKTVRRGKGEKRALAGHGRKGRQKIGMAGRG